MIADIYKTQEYRIFRSKTLPADYVFDYPGQFEEVYISTAPDALIHGLYFKSKERKGVVLYLHGRGYNLASLNKRPGIPMDFSARGYDLFIPDYRGFGKSTGKRSQKALFHDANCAYNFLLEKYPEEQITVYGMSFGTGVATKIAENRHPKQLILEAPYKSMLSMAKKAIPFMPKFITAWILNYHVRTDNYIQNVKCPIHIFHGTHDDLIPHKSSEKLLKRIKNGVKAKLTSITRGDHDHLPSFHEYTKQLDLLLD